MKKAFTILLALALMLSLSSIAMAANITITGGANGSQYVGYRLLNATDGGEGKFAYTLNEKYAEILATATGKTAEAEIVDYIRNLDDAGIRTLADTVYVAIAEAGLEADCVATDDVFANADQGYYLIAETAVGDATDTFSLVMVDTKGVENLEVKTKEDKPTVIKTVLEKNDTTGVEVWGDSADYDFGDVINYTITGRVSNQYLGYKSYYYSVNDTMDKGLTYNQDAKIYVETNGNKVDVTEYFIITESTNEESGYANGFVAEVNLKELDAENDEITINGDSKIIVEYTATLNEFAVAGPEGNKNVVYIEYENNPYTEGDGDSETPDRPGDDDDQPGGDDDDENGPGKSEEDVNIVFTFDAIINKVDKNGNALEGAGFTLYKSFADEGWKQIGEEITGVTTFTFESLDSGMYKLVETKIPNGYNKCADIVFEVVGEYDTTTDPDTLTGLKVLNADGENISTGDKASFNATLALGQVSTDVVNHTGAELPETGGMGTTIIYIIGAVLAVGAVVLLVTMKRMKNEQ